MSEVEKKLKEFAEYLKKIKKGVDRAGRKWYPN